MYSCHKMCFCLIRQNLFYIIIKFYFVSHDTFSPVSVITVATYCGFRRSAVARQTRNMRYFSQVQLNDPTVPCAINFKSTNKIIICISLQDGFILPHTAIPHRMVKHVPSGTAEYCWLHTARTYRVTFDEQAVAAQVSVIFVPTYCLQISFKFRSYPFEAARTYLYVLCTQTRIGTLEYRENLGRLS